MRLLPQYAPVHLLAIAEGLVRGDDGLQLLARAGLGRDETARREIERSLSELGSQSLAYLLRAVAVERQAANEEWDKRLELVWTGPERPGAGTRDTAVVVRELFQSAEQDVIVAGYALFNARPIFEPLANRMMARPGLRVIVFLNVASHGGHLNPESVVEEFGRNFVTSHWPRGPLPEVYYDPRSIAQDGGQRAVLHAKCVVIDRTRTFITSANITEAAQERNIELGVVINDAAFGTLVHDQFAGLVEGGFVKPVALKR